MDSCDVLVLYEHPEWQKPLFAALERRGVSFGALDLKRAAFVPGDPIPAKLVFNQVRICKSKPYYLVAKVKLARDVAGGTRTG